MVETLNTLIGIEFNGKLSSQTFTDATNSLAMLSKANNYINEMKRDDVLSQLGKNIRQIRFNIPKESKTLFAEDISKRSTSAKKI